MNAAARVGLWLAVFCSVVSTGLAIVALRGKTIDVNSVLGAIGCVVTAVAFVVGAYFAVMAVSAYSHLLEVDRARMAVEQHRREMEALHVRAKLLAIEMVEVMDEFISEEIGRVTGGGDGSATDSKARRKLAKKRRCELYRRRARLAIDHDSLKPERRMSLIRELTQFGTPEDAGRLQKLTECDAVPQELRDLARSVCNVIQQGEPKM